MNDTRHPGPIMSALISRLSRLSPRAFMAQESGIAAVEFALILPILLILWIGGVEVTGALSADRRINNLASSIGDLVAQSEDPVTQSAIDDIFSIAESAMFPYDPREAAMRVTAVYIDKNRVPRVSWSRAKGSQAAYGAGTTMNVVPASLRQPDTQVLMSEVYFKYRPAVGYVVTGNLDLQDRMFFVPRRAPKLRLCDKPAPPNTCSQ
jgi:Flp pilus assembly protein TadG